ncbi:LOW QUALITY PROTEIN: hypothetical protein ACHAW6_011195 [Cyclotella cf. meneghiniana]
MAACHEELASCIQYCSYIREEKFSRVKVGFNMHHNNTFGCPVYALNNALAAGGKIPKWFPRSRLEINHGPSQQHAPNVSLVLNLDTGLVSQQFHCQYDDFVETISFNKLETMMSSNGQILAGLERPDKTPMVEQDLQRARPPQPIARNANPLIPDQNPAHIPHELSFINFNYFPT